MPKWLEDLGVPTCLFQRRVEVVVHDGRHRYDTFLGKAVPVFPTAGASVHTDGVKKAEPPATDSLVEKRLRKRAAAFVLVMSLALFAFSLNQGVFYATLNVSAILAMTFVIARVR